MNHLFRWISWFVVHDFVIILADYSGLSVFLFYSVLVLFSALRWQGEDCNVNCSPYQARIVATVRYRNQSPGCVIADNGVVPAMRPDLL